ncbi:hypothetical protein SK128_010041 [Halocaridina rubra]|uniref:Uncharacterized protein n=1 Tax=Halocaridina rubra TaxID=373956 RepID=A0AAN8XFF0_HALRR
MELPFKIPLIIDNAPDHPSMPRGCVQMTLGCLMQALFHGPVTVIPITGMST